MTHPNANVDTIEYDVSNSELLPSVVETDTFTLRRISHEHVDKQELYELFNSTSEDVFKYCSWQQIESIEEIEKLISHQESQWEKKSRFEYVIELSASNEYVGTTYIRFPGSINEVGILGMWLQKHAWGSGLSGERADVILHLAFNELQTGVVTVGCLAPNVQSRRAIVKYIERYNGSYYGCPPKFGSQYDKDNDNEVLPHHEFQVMREDYFSRKTGIRSSIPGVDWDEITFKNSQ